MGIPETLGILERGAEQKFQEFKESIATGNWG